MGAATRSHARALVFAAGEQLRVRSWNIDSNKERHCGQSLSRFGQWSLFRRLITHQALHAVDTSSISRPAKYLQLGETSFHAWLLQNYYIARIISLKIETDTLPTNYITCYYIDDNFVLLQTERFLKKKLFPFNIWTESSIGHIIDYKLNQGKNSSSNK